MVTRESIRQVLLRMSRLGIAREDLQEEFIRGSGAGGQKINKTSSSVRLRHLPTGLEVRCQEERSLSRNRTIARSILCDRLEERLRLSRQGLRAAIARKRRQNARPSANQKRKNIASKRHRSTIKAGRKSPGSDE